MATIFGVHARTSAYCCPLLVFNIMLYKIILYIWSIPYKTWNFIVMSLSPSSNPGWHWNKLTHNQYPLSMDFKCIESRRVNDSDAYMLSQRYPIARAYPHGGRRQVLILSRNASVGMYSRCDELSLTISGCLYTFWHCMPSLLHPSILY
jgi:hypothetical protein